MILIFIFTLFPYLSVQRELFLNVLNTTLTINMLKGSFANSLNISFKTCRICANQFVSDRLHNQRKRENCFLVLLSQAKPCHAVDKFLPPQSQRRYRQIFWLFTNKYYILWSFRKSRLYSVAQGNLNFQQIESSFLHYN